MILLEELLNHVESNATDVVHLAMCDTVRRGKKNDPYVKVTVRTLRNLYEDAALAAQRAADFDGIMSFKPITTTQAAEQLGISRQAFHQSVLPLLAQRGDAVQMSDRAWAIDGSTFWMWTVYAETRRKLIDDPAETQWTKDRPWSVEDMEAIALEDAYPDHHK